MAYSWLKTVDTHFLAPFAVQDLIGSQLIVPMMSTVDPHIGIGAQHSMISGSAAPSSEHKHRVPSIALIQLHL